MVEIEKISGFLDTVFTSSYLLYCRVLCRSVKRRVYIGTGADVQNALKNRKGMMDNFFFIFRQSRERNHRYTLSNDIMS